MNYLCLVFDEGAGSEESARLADTDLDLEGRWGHRVGPASAGVTVRVRSGELLVAETTAREDGEPDTGREYLLVEAKDLNEAIRLVSRLPGARFGRVELRPVFRARGSEGSGRTG